MKLVSLALIAFAGLAEAQTAVQGDQRAECLPGSLISTQQDSITVKFNEKIVTLHLTPETEIWRRGVDLKSTSELVPGDDISVKCAATPAADGWPIATLIAAAMDGDSIYLDPHHVHEIRVCGGDLIDIQPQAITINSDDGPCIMTVPPGIDIWRGEIYHDTGVLKIGDDVMARVTVSFPSGELIAEEITSNIAITEGAIVSAAKDFIVVDQYPGADPDSAYPRGRITVLLDGSTKFDDCTLADLKKGANIRALGLDTGPDQFRATYITVYKDLPGATKPPIAPQ